MVLPVSLQPQEFQEAFHTMRYAVQAQGCFVAVASAAFYLFLYSWEPPADGPMHRDAPSFPGIWEDQPK